LELEKLKKTKAVRIIKLKNPVPALGTAQLKTLFESS